MDFTRSQSLTDIVHTSIDYTGIEAAILGTPIFNRLHRILQSSLVFLTYPSNKTKRFEHSVGVMDLAGKMFFSSVSNSNDQVLQEFFDEIVNSIKNWRQNAGSEHLSSVVSPSLQIKYNTEKILTMPIPQCAIYNKYLPKNLVDLNSPEYVVAYFVVFQAVRIAGLLHDVGHLPYSHVLEYAIKKLYYKVNDIPLSDRNENQNHFIDILKNYCDKTCKDKDEIHEEIGKISVSKIFESIATHLDKNGDNNLFYITTFDFAGRILQSSASNNDIYSDIHTIVAGIVDADRLDYCTRDALASGLNSNIINYERLLSTFSICRRKKDAPLSNEEIDKGSPAQRDRFYFCPHVKNVSIVEDLLKRRWEIFSLINYHHRVHKHEILLEEAIVDLGLEELSSLEKINRLEQGGLPLKIYSVWEIISMLKGNEPPEYLLVQFDDSWLDTLLKRKFFKYYKDEFSFSPQNANDIKWNRLDELISSQKHYYSALKRFEDFKNNIDEKLFEKVKEFLPSKTDVDTNANKMLQLFTDGIGEENTYLDFFVHKKCLFFAWFIDHLITPIGEKNGFYERIQNKINSDNMCKSSIKDIIIRDCTFKTGCPSPTNLLMIADNEGAKPFQNYSTIEQYFIIQRNCSLPFHMYYLPSYPAMESTNKIEDELFESFIKICFDEIKNYIKQ